MEAATPIYPGSIQIRSESRQLSSSNLDLTKPSSHVSSCCCIPILPFLKISMTQSQPQKDAFLSELDILIGSRKMPPRPHLDPPQLSDGFVHSEWISSTHPLIFSECNLDSDE